MAKAKTSKSAEQIVSALKARLAGYQDSQTVCIGVNNAEVATYAQFYEYGWVQRVTPKQTGYFRRNYGMNLRVGTILNNPPRPFLRGTFKAEQTAWASALKKALVELGSTKAALTYVGAIAQEDVKQSLMSGGTKLEKFEERSDFTMAMLSSDYDDGQKLDGTGTLFRRTPGIRSGVLHRSITYWMKDK